MVTQTLLYIGEKLERQGVPRRFTAPLDRQSAFWDQVTRLGLVNMVRVVEPCEASSAELQRFHDEGHVNWVKTRSRIGHGFIDDEDTQAYPGIYEDQAARVGSALDGLTRIMRGEAQRSFQPVGGLHHARRHRAAGLCAFSDIGVVIETLRGQYGLQRLAYIDIDAHHADGVFYTYESEPGIIFADIHEDGRYLYPGTGQSDETGKGDAAGTKLNIPLAPGAEDSDFFAAWESVEAHMREYEPEFLIFQCGADCIAGDPMADLQLSPAAHRHAARRLVALAERFSHGRMMAFGGGGYVLDNVTAAWTSVLQEMIGGVVR